MSRRNIEDIFDESVHPELREKLSILEQLRMEVELADRKYMRKTYEKCFLGTDAVDALIRILSGRSGGTSVSRDQAVEVGNELITANLILHVTRDHIFKDAPLFYRFIEDAMTLEHGDGNRAAGLWQTALEDLLSSDEEDIAVEDLTSMNIMRHSVESSIAELARVTDILFRFIKEEKNSLDCSSSLFFSLR